MDLELFIKIVQPYSMTSIERITELYNSLEYIRLNNINGDVVECGVWKGGNILGHDYEPERFPGVVNAVNEFCDKYELSIDSLSNDGLPSFLIKLKK